jgi:hypothetical protein
MQRATGVMEDIKGSMNTRKMETLQENQVRNTQQNSVAQLRNVERVSVFVFK